MAVGATYSGTSTAPTNGMIVEGDVGIGTASPSHRLDVVGVLNVTSALVSTSCTMVAGTCSAATHAGCTNPVCTPQTYLAGVSPACAVTAGPNVTVVSDGADTRVVNILCL
jgi:hypothetical protein